MHRTPFATLAAALLLAAGTAGANDVAGQKLDNGLGALPHYSQWADKSGRQPVAVRVAGESLDDGLAGLPHYRYWVDKSGRDPLGREPLRMAAKR